MLSSTLWYISSVEKLYDDDMPMPCMTNHKGDIVMMTVMSYYHLDFQKEFRINDEHKSGFISIIIRPNKEIQHFISK